jgi:hypothetical protein
VFVSISVPAMDTALDGPLTGASDWAHASSERVGVVPGSWNSHKAPADHLISAQKQSSTAAASRQYGARTRSG